MERWITALAEGRQEEAWDEFLGRYRGLVFAAIRSYVRKHDDVMDVFASVCEALRKDDFHRLRQYSAHGETRARFTTWLVVVVRHLTIDWLRRRNGRPRVRSGASGLSPLQQRIAENVISANRGHAETFERIRSRDEPSLTFAAFLKELAAVYRTVPAARRCSDWPAVEMPHISTDGAEAREARDILDAALASLDAPDRAAVMMYVVDELPAAEVARVLRLSNAKAVYNRVYRALAEVRGTLERAGLVRGDL
jgi:RNA polymerase sigma factor (sigma-70 family)